MNRAQEVKHQLLPRMQAVCRYLLPKGRLEGGCWRVGSIRGELGSSLSVSCEGPRTGCWNDFAESEDHQGDVLKLWMMVRNMPFSDALDEAGIWLERGAPASLMPTSPESPWRLDNDTYTPVPMPRRVARDWQHAVSYLVANPAIQYAMDQWRGWPLGTTALLSRRGLIGLIQDQGESAYAFAVEFPVDGACLTIGYHARLLDAGVDTKATWMYRPNVRIDRVGIPAIPFVLGADQIHHAKLVVVLEGQWDAVTWAAAAGWLNRWPRGVAVFGIRGATSWRHLPTYWGHLWPRTAKFLLVPDGDAAGQQWRGEFVRVLLQRAAAVQIFDTPSGADFSDLNHREHFTSAAIAELLRRHHLSLNHE